MTVCPGKITGPLIFSPFGIPGHLPTGQKFKRYSDKMCLFSLLLLFLRVHSLTAGDNGENQWCVFIPVKPEQCSDD